MPRAEASDAPERLGSAQSTINHIARKAAGKRELNRFKCWIYLTDNEQHARIYLHRTSWSQQSFE
jgi:hypothetical protein